MITASEVSKKPGAVHLLPDHMNAALRLFVTARRADSSTPFQQLQRMRRRVGLARGVLDRVRERRRPDDGVGSLPHVQGRLSEGAGHLRRTSASIGPWSSSKTRWTR